MPNLVTPKPMVRALADRMTTLTEKVDALVQRLGLEDPEPPTIPPRPIQIERRRETKLQIVFRRAA